MIILHCHPTFLSLQSYHPLCGYDCSPQAGFGTQPYHFLHSNVGSSVVKNHLPSMQSHRSPCFIHTTHLYSSCTVTVPQTGTAFLAPELITTISPGKTHLMDNKIIYYEESHCLGHSDLKMCEL